ncbi:hypothetical protein CNYM01_14296 [Colletotrichum nymphaeae SA-01]|uniref:Uncharacterized protein n=1 Tax=Colletotrichum nymphaeae SA-01 TaxID=1460502 RepID=A0A135U4T3_9PEZI|nr:hypothetical protein CNYM01_14296 [Colletotrichum nymphaeae SA-01]
MSSRRLKASATRDRTSGKSSHKTGASGRTPKHRDKEPNDNSKTRKPQHKDSKDDGTKYIASLHCAIYTPHFGNYYHWAFATHDQSTRQWNVFEVVQDEEDGPFRAQCLQTNPANSRRCITPIINLCIIHSGWLETLFSQIPEIPVPGEGLSWNCQDYVIDIWDTAFACGAIDEGTWYAGKQEMLRYYGQDFGQDGEGGEDEEHEGDEGEEGQGGPLSEEFVFDSSFED